MIRLLSCFVFLRVSAVQGNAAAPQLSLGERVRLSNIKKRQKKLTSEALDALTWLKADELTIMARTDSLAQDLIQPYMKDRLKLMSKSPFVETLVKELRLVDKDQTLSESQNLLEEYIEAASLMTGADAGAAAAGSVSRP
jgi:hypothetical protein